METNFNFKSQICTSRSQSERLLSLGLKKETADMVYRSYGYIIDEFGDKERRFKQPTLVVDGWGSKYDIPAWSLGRLLEVMRMKASSQIVPLDDTFDRLIEGIEIRIKEGYFNKEYLENGNC